jgi:hypothetical protein
MTVALGITAPAWAGVTAKRTSAVEHVGSGTWGAQGTTLSWGLLGLLSTTYKYFTVPNTGTLDLVSATYTTTGNGLSAATVTLTACVGATWSTGGSGSCSGTTVPLGTAGGGATTAPTPIPAGSSLSVQAKAVVTLSLSLSTTTTVTVARSNVRAARTTNS